MRIGMGYDVHRLGRGYRLVIGGEDIPFEMGLIGHSDADVLLHAIMDALLGAAALGDIGKHFPDTDEKYRGISSLKLLSHVGDLLGENHFIIENIDATIIAQQPKMRPHIDTMRENIAKTLGIEVSQVNVKATTEEGLGFTGNGEGISAQAVCLISSADELRDDSVVVGTDGGTGCPQNTCGRCPMQGEQAVVTEKKEAVTDKKSDKPEKKKADKPKKKDKKEKKDKKSKKAKKS